MVPAALVAVGVPPVVVDHATIPIAVVVEPHADRERDPERPVRRPHAEVVDRLVVDHLRVVHRHVDHRRPRGDDPDRRGLDLDPLFCGRDQVPLRARHPAQTLHRGHHVPGLHRVRLSQCRPPVRTLSEHVQHWLVVRDRLHADVPPLFVDPRRSVGADIPCGECDLVGVRRCDQHLCQDRVRVERDRRQQIVEFLDRVQLTRLGLLHAGRRILRDERRREGRQSGGRRDQRQREHGGESESHGGAGHLLSCVPEAPRRAFRWRMDVSDRGDVGAILPHRTSGRV